MPVLLSRSAKYFFVDPVNGADGNPGDAPNRAFATLYQLHNKMTSGNNDVGFLIGAGTSAGSAILSLANAQTIDSTATTGTLTWSKNACHLVGVSAPSISPRARIGISGTEATFNALPFITVSGNGCYFSNIATAQEFTTGANGEINFNVTGSYNVFNNVFMGGMLNAEAGAGANSRVLTITGGGENKFIGCRLGVSTIARSAANASIEFKTGTARNEFHNCVLACRDTTGGAFFILVTATGLNDYALFTNCWFINTIHNSATAMATAASCTTNTPGGTLIFANCNSVGVTKWGDTNALAKSEVSNVGGAATDGLMLNPS